jgi:hypothetical protein
MARADLRWKKIIFKRLKSFSIEIEAEQFHIREKITELSEI